MNWLKLLGNIPWIMSIVDRLRVDLVKCHCGMYPQIYKWELDGGRWCYGCPERHQQGPPAWSQRGAKKAWNRMIKRGLE